MATIQVSINRTGDITCDDSVLQVGSTITWQPSGGTITSIVGGDPTPFRGTPQRQPDGTWTAVVIGAGSYTITDSAGKRRSPRISIVTPMPV